MIEDYTNESIFLKNLQDRYVCCDVYLFVMTLLVFAASHDMHLCSVTVL